MLYVCAERLHVLPKLLGVPTKVLQLAPELLRVAPELLKVEAETVTMPPNCPKRPLTELGDKARDEPLIATRFEERNGIVSADGHWLAYTSDSSGRLEVYVRPFPDIGKGLWQVSTSGGDQALWAPDGRELFYRTPDGAIMAVQIDVAAGKWNAGPPAPLARAGYFTGNPFWASRQYDIARDGRRFIVLKEAAPAEASTPAISPVQNWFEELKRLVPTN